VTHPTKILNVISMAFGDSLDARVEGKVVSLLASVDGVEQHFLIPERDWRRIVENADWWRDKTPLPQRV
jgi:hypothetical protein